MIGLIAASVVREMTGDAAIRRGDHQQKSMDFTRTARSTRKRL